MSKGDAKARKAEYFARLNKYFGEYKQVMLVCADNVGSHQMHQIRISLRGKAVIVMGKNTMMRRAMRGMFAAQPEIEKLYPHIVGNIGLVFTNENLKDIREYLLKNRVAAPARAGALAPIDVFIPPQNTGMGPEKTSFFQALGINTKIAKGTIEILTEQHLVKAGDRVGPSEAALLNMLKISPFTYGLSLTQIFQGGACFSPEVLDITDEQLLSKFSEAITAIAAISLATGFASKPAVIHSLMNGYKKVLSIALATDYTFPLAEKAKEYLKDPSKFAAAAPAAAGPAKGAAPAAAAAKKEKTPEPSSEEEMGMGLFD